MYPDQNRPLREELSALAQGVVILFVVFWATGLGGWLARTLPEIARDRNPFASQRLEKEREWRGIFIEKLKTAKALGKNYTVERYFADLKDSIPYNRKYQVTFMFGDLTQLQQLLNQNGEDQRTEDYQARLHRLQNMTDVVRERVDREVAEATAKADAAYAASHPSPPPQAWWAWLLALGGWVVSTYLKVGGLSAILYLLRALGDPKERKLVSLKRFAEAIRCWPRDIWEYPYPAFRQFIAQAEVRRSKGSLKDFLAPLSKREKALVRKVAESRQGFRAWRTGYRSKYPARAGLVVALVLCLTLVPLASFAREVKHSEKTPVITSTTHQGGASCIAQAPDPPWVHPDATLPTPFPDTFERPPRLRVAPPEYVGAMQQGWLRDIFHVPLTRQMLVI